MLLSIYFFHIPNPHCSFHFFFFSISSLALISHSNLCSSIAVDGLLLRLQALNHLVLHSQLPNHLIEIPTPIPVPISAFDFFNAHGCGARYSWVSEGVQGGGSRGQYDDFGGVFGWALGGRGGPRRELVWRSVCALNPILPPNPFEGSIVVFVNEVEVEDGRGKRVWS